LRRDSSLADRVRDFLDKLAAGIAARERKRREREALEHSFANYRVQVGERTWKRADLHPRS